MRRRILLLAFYSVLALLPATEATAAGATIRGRIVAADTGQPLRRVKVNLNQENADPNHHRTATTDADGHYSITDVVPGRYTLSVFRNGYLQMQYGQRRPLEIPRLLDVQDHSVIDHADFALQRMAIISGQITDERNEPAADVLVVAMRPVYADGRRQMIPESFNVRTDDSGRYRFSTLVPGTYVVMASTLETWTARTGADDVLGFAPTFFPGTADATKARPITVSYAERKVDVNFSLAVAQTVRVSGTAFDSSGKPLAGRRIGLIQPFRGASGGGGGRQVADATVAADGTFLFPHVLPGEYKLQARGPAPQSASDEEAAAQVLTVGSTNVDRIVLKTSLGWSITGQIRTEAGVTPTLAPSAARVIVTVPEATNPRGGPPGGKTRISDDWTFSATDLFGPARLRLELPGGWTVKGIEYGGTDVSDRAIEGASGQEVKDVRIIVTNHVTKMEGRAILPNGTGTGASTVIVFATDARKWGEGSRFVRAVRPSDDGSWEVIGLPPGEYLAVALDYAPQGLWNDPDYLSGLRQRGQRVTVPENGVSTVVLRVLASS